MYPFKAIRFLAGATFTVLTLINQPAIATVNSNDTISKALQGEWGQLKVNLRYRFEHVDQDGLETANGDPIRLRLGYLTPKLADFQAYVEVLGNTPVFIDNFNDGSNGKTEYATIGDPNEVALNQFWLSFEQIPATTIKVGRQKIAWDNQRFICPSGWRQMEQSFDSITLLNNSLGNISVKAAFLLNVLPSSNKKVSMHSPLINLKYNFGDIGSLVGYGYWLDYDDPDDSGPFEYAYSSQTYGLRFNGSSAIADNLKLLYTAEYASQSDYQDNPKDFNADYYTVIGGLLAPGEGSLFKNLTGKIGYEVLGSDSNVSFQTPIGANHRHNGWADIFAKTKPATGLQDLYGSLSASVSGVKVELVYHDFQADTGGSDYGAEIDIKLTRKFLEHYTVLTSYSFYNADEFKTDTQKFWLQLTVEF